MEESRDKWCLRFLFERKRVFTLKKDSIDIANLEEVEMELIDFG